MGCNHARSPVPACRLLTKGHNTMKLMKLHRPTARWPRRAEEHYIDGAPPEVYAVQYAGPGTLGRPRRDHLRPEGYTFWLDPAYDLESEDFAFRVVDVEVIHLETKVSLNVTAWTEHRLSQQAIRRNRRRVAWAQVSKPARQTIEDYVRGDGTYRNDVNLMDAGVIAVFDYAECER